MLHLATVSAKSFVAVNGEEEAIPLIAKAKSAFPVDAGLSHLRCCCREEEESDQQDFYMYSTRYLKEETPDEVW